MIISSIRWVTTAVSAALLIGTPAAGATVLAKVPGAVTKIAADGTSVAYATNINSRACPGPLLGDRQQVVYLNARTRKSVLLTTVKGCDTQTGPGFAVATERWLAISGKHVFWIDAISSGDHLTTRINVATPGSKPVRGAQVDTNQGFGSSYGPLVAGGGLGFANLTTTQVTDATACNGGSGNTVACAPLVVGDELHSFDAAGGEKTVLVNTAPIPRQIQAVSAGSALLQDPSGALSVVHAVTPGASSIPLVGSSVDEAAMDRLLVVGLTRVGSRVRLGFWNAATGARTGSCQAAVGASSPGVALAGGIAAFATKRGIYAVTGAAGTRSACGADKLVNLPKGTRLAGFALTSTGGLIYATNTGTKTVRSIVSRLSPTEIAAATHTCDSNK